MKLPNIALLSCSLLFEAPSIRATQIPAERPPEALPGKFRYESSEADPKALLYCFDLEFPLFDLQKL